MSGAYYNEFEPYAAEWLRNLIKRRLIADGEVDSRSIIDVRGDDLRRFTQCHFFAGIGVWSYALRLAGWPDDQPVWTGSCPCQPFSAAGKGKGFEDERHLWPHFHRLIAECRPAVVFGEQVASKDGLRWLDALCLDMEASGYAVGAADLCAASRGAPHIRQRLWFVGERLADASAGGWREQQAERGEAGAGRGGYTDLRIGNGGLADAESSGSGAGLRDHGSTGQRGHIAADGCSDGGLGHHHHQGLEGQWRGHQAERGWLGAVRPVAEAGEPRGMADTEHDDRRPDEPGRGSEGRAADGRGGAVGWVADADGRDASAERKQRGGQQRQQQEDGGTGCMEHTCGVGREWRETSAFGHDNDGQASERAQGEHGLGVSSSHRISGSGPRPTDGHWRAADWLYCRDGKWRPVEPGTFPLVDGSAFKLGSGSALEGKSRVGMLRAYGNAIVASVAAEVIAAFMECRP